MLIVMEDRNVAAFFQFLFDLKASWRGNILKVDSTERSGQEAYSLNDLINIFAANAKRNGIYTTEFFKEHTFTFHNRHTCFRTDISKSQYCSSVCDNSNCIPASCQLIALIYVFLDFKTRLSNTRCVSKA